MTVPAKQTEPDEVFLPCSCSHLHHMVSFTFHPYGPHDKAGDFEAYVQVSLDYEQSWWGRLKTAWRYLLRRTCGYGDVSEIIVRDRDLPSLRAWLDRAERDVQKRETEHEAMRANAAPPLRPIRKETP